MEIRSPPPCWGRRLAGNPVGLSHVPSSTSAPVGFRDLTDETLIYESPNGDRWFLTEAHPERLLVRHQPNLASGGRTAFFEVDVASQAAARWDPF
jgi:hypothetical protein